MSKTFKANPTNDKHNLKKRILEIESNPTTTTSSTVTKITSGDVGDGLVITEDTKLNLNLGDGLEVVGNKVGINYYTNHFVYEEQYGLYVKNGALNASLFLANTWGDGLTAGTSGKVNLNISDGLEIDDSGKVKIAANISIDTLTIGSYLSVKETCRTGDWRPLILLNGFSSQPTVGEGCEFRVIEFRKVLPEYKWYKVEFRGICTVDAAFTDLSKTHNYRGILI